MTRRYYRRAEQIWKFTTDNDGETRAFVRIVGSTDGWVPSVMHPDDMTSPGIVEISESEGEDDDEFRYFKFRDMIWKMPASGDGQQRIVGCQTWDTSGCSALDMDSCPAIQEISAKEGEIQ